MKKTSILTIVITAIISAAITFAIVYFVNKGDQKNEANNETVVMVDTEDEDTDLEKDEEIIIRNTRDSLAHYMGLSFGKSIIMQNNMLAEEVDMDLFFRSVNYALENENVDEQTMMEFLNNYMYSENPKLCAKKSEKWLAKIGKQKGVRKTESGLLYKVVRKGSDKRATADKDVVKVNYEGKLMNGYVFDSSYKRNQPAEFALNQVIKGWTEGMKLVGEGGEIILYIPSDLAYGTWGNQRGGIGPNHALEFRVELLEVKPAE